MYFFLAQERFEQNSMPFLPNQRLRYCLHQFTYCFIYRVFPISICKFPNILRMSSSSLVST